MSETPAEQTKTEPVQAGEVARPPPLRLHRGISVLDLVLRIVAVAGTLASSIAMATTNQTLPFITQNFQFRAEYNDLPAFTFFVITNSIVCGYLVFSLPLSIFHIIKSAAKKSRIVLLTFDAAMLALVTAGASAAAATVYLAHKGNVNANWPAVCQQFDLFCERTSGSLIGSFGSAIMLILIISTSAVAISLL
ncbi:hypothetical protein HS088_TW07G01048 [Tripterygium wilfordii]|uniref:CASP-like protein n=1 Tax=Tripterygium wilfordii TaxID=458696 RepID=A0A7J7DGT1_TRIWF|nr:casparian strip membrane protein 1-like [Tripterygium wilfordii]KAF5745464.1 hypothetical protein HS088_TW07G01048 [Tripterygium wilfordii]